MKNYINHNLDNGLPEINYDQFDYILILDVIEHLKDPENFFVELKEKFDDFLTFVILGIIIGGRLGYVILYNPNYYLDNLIDIFKIWEGGMSFHGGLIGVVLASFYFAKKNNQNFFIYLDVISIVAPIGIFFGRIANFINGELFGRITNHHFGIIFPNGGKHPSIS